jgi:biotin operon repressor
VSALQSSKSRHATGEVSSIDQQGESMNLNQYKILSALASGKFYSHPELAEHTDMVVQNIPRHLDRLTELGVQYTGGGGRQYGEAYRVQAFGVFDPDGLREFLVRQGYSIARKEIT